MTEPFHRARELHRRLTDAEKFVWSRLRDRRFAQLKFRRQVPLGTYYVDFVCFQRRLTIELDRRQHTLERSYDEPRTRWLESEGFRVARFWNQEVLGHRETVEEAIWRQLQNPSPPTPLPQGSGENSGGVCRRELFFGNLITSIALNSVCHIACPKPR